MRKLTVKGVVIGEGIPKTIVSLMGGNLDELLEQARRGIDAGADCFEYRADFAADPHDGRALTATARALREALPGNPVLFTFRTAGQGGQAALSARELEDLYRAVIAVHGADLVDIESWLGDDAVRGLCAEAHEAGMAAIVSFHDFEGTPPQLDMQRMLARFDELGADVAKVAVMARSAADVVALLAATERACRDEASCPLLTIAMGPIGTISRLAGETFGSALTFCSLDRASAPGQMDVRLARDLMAQLHELSFPARQTGNAAIKTGADGGTGATGAAGAIDGRTHLVTLLGKPTHHSLSPAMHNLSFGLLGINAVYLCFDVEPQELGAVMGALRAMDAWDGANVTMPCKQAIMAHLDELDETAELVGAVNVVKKLSDGRLAGYNTDGVGFMESLARSGFSPKGARMALLGPGGAGSAILAQAALDGVAHIDVFARSGGASARHAQDLAARVSRRTGCVIELHALPERETCASRAGTGDVGAAAIDALSACIDAADILVNATPVGMGEGCTDSPVPPSLLRPGLLVADVIYHPRETQLIRDAKARGCAVATGLGMLIGQAAAGEAIWYGARMPIGEIEKRLFG